MTDLLSGRLRKMISETQQKVCVCVCVLYALNLENMYI